MIVCKDAIKKHYQTEKSLYSKMFAPSVKPSGDTTTEKGVHLGSVSDPCDCATELITDSPNNDSFADQTNL
jgi:hypothetical protein